VEGIVGVMRQQLFKSRNQYNGGEPCDIGVQWDAERRGDVHGQTQMGQELNLIDITFIVFFLPF
jgi:hypothetical protein